MFFESGQCWCFPDIGRKFIPEVGEGNEVHLTAYNLIVLTDYVYARCRTLILYGRCAGINWMAWHYMFMRWLEEVSTERTWVMKRRDCSERHLTVVKNFAVIFDPKRVKIVRVIAEDSLEGHTWQYCGTIGLVCRVLLGFWRWRVSWAVCAYTSTPRSKVSLRATSSGEV